MSATAAPSHGVDMLRVDTLVDDHPATLIYIDDVDADDASIVLAITPTRGGQVTIDGADVSFRAGIRHGTQHVGTTILVTTQ